MEQALVLSKMTGLLNSIAPKGLIKPIESFNLMLPVPALSVKALVFAVKSESIVDLKCISPSEVLIVTAS